MTILEKLSDEISIVPSTREELRPFIQKHYLESYPAGVKASYLVKQKDGQSIGMVIYGSIMPAAAKLLQPYIFPNEIVELKRLFIEDVGIKNIESYVIAKTLKMIKESVPEIKAVITFADSEVGHKGTIYQATNAVYLGKSVGGKHKYLYILRDESTIRKLIHPKEYPKE